MIVLKQILREFSVPFIISIAWMVLNLWRSHDPWSLINAMNIFGPTFFLVSWATGQFFRIRKQLGVESHLSRLKSDLEVVARDIRSQTQELSSYATGGDGFIYFLPQMFMPHGFVVMSLTQGGYPLYNVHATARVLGSSHSEMDIPIGDTKAGVSKVHFLPVDLSQSDEFKLRLWITARNGAQWQDVWLRKLSDQWTFAIRVRTDRNVVRYQQIDPDFPVEGSEPFAGFDES